MTIFIYIIAALVSISSGYALNKVLSRKKIQDAKQAASQILEQTKKEVENLKKEAELEGKDMILRLRQDFEAKTQSRREELIALEKRLSLKEDNVDRRLALLEKKEKELDAKYDSLRINEDALKAKDKQLAALINEEKERLQKIANLTIEEGKQVLLARLSDELNNEKAVLIRNCEEEIKTTADKRARELISLAVQRCAVEHTVESTVSVVSLPSDEMKGRIIGREGRNIRALEMATGVDVVIDDTPEAVTISGFDPVRREIAKLTLEKLMSDGRIHPGRIEEIAEKTKREMEDKIREEGERAVFEIGLHGLHPELVKLIGRLKFRTSYGQNALQHSKEVAYLMGVMASELNMDFRLSRRIGLLHDIGKAVDHQVEGTHARIGAELAKKYGENNEVIAAIECHHEDHDPKSLLGVMAIAADAISAARPGARRESLEAYVKKLGELEAIANSFKGVEKSYAIQAGREIRVIVQPDRLSDNDTVNLAREIRKKIEGSMDYPGQVKVTAIREMRAIEYAK